MKKTYEYVRDKLLKGKKGLIYVNLNENKDKLQDYLDSKGIKAGILDGSHTTTPAKKYEVAQSFIKNEYDCVITNLTMGLDLPCDYICFHELTFDFKQMLGRGERGLSSKDLEIAFIIVDNSEEVSYFYENVYKRMELLGLVCNKDVSEINEALNIINKSIKM